MRDLALTRALRCCVAFLASPRLGGINQEMHDTAEQLWQCRCGTSRMAKTIGAIRQISALHNIGTKEASAATCPSHAFQMLVALMSVRVSMAVQEVVNTRHVYKAKRNLKRAARSGEPLAFPEYPQDLLPYGPAETFRFLGKRLLDDNEGSMSHLISLIIMATRSEAVPAVVSSYDILDHVLNTAESAWDDVIACTDQPITQRSKPYIRILAIAELLRCIFSYADERERRRLATLRAVPETRMACQRGISAIFLLSARVTDPERLPTLEMAMGGFAELSAWTYDTLHEAFPLPNLSPIPHDTWRRAGMVVSQKLAQLRAERAQDLHEEAMIALLALPNVQRCWAPGCLQTYAGTCRKFAVCAACLHVPYCSQKCQRGAWRHTKLPHRDVCAQMRKMVAIIDGAMLAADSQAAVPALELIRTKITLETARKINAHIEGLRAALSESISKLFVFNSPRGAYYYY